MRLRKNKMWENIGKFSIWQHSKIVYTKCGGGEAVFQEWNHFHYRAGSLKKIKRCQSGVGANPRWTWL